MAIYNLGGINWTWYADVTDHGDDSATLNKYWRLHNWRDVVHPKSIGGFLGIKETPDRQAIALEFSGGMTKKIRNQKHVSDYN